MKTFLISTTFVFLVTSSFSQSFKRGTIVFDANMGLEGLNSTQYYNHINNIADTSIQRDAGNLNFSIGMEVGITKRIGVGVRGKTNTYFQDIDAISRDRTQIKSNDLLVSLALHPLKRKKLGLAIGMDLGLSDIDLQFDNPTETILASKGRYFAFFVNPRFYIKRFGINVRATLPQVNYKRFVDEAKIIGTDYSLSRWQASGIGVSVGIQYRIF